MTTRAMWKGILCIADARVPVKLYSAVEDHDIRFRLLHEKDLVPVEQALVHPETNDVVRFEQTQRGYFTPEGSLVVLQPDELAQLTPKDSRDIAVDSFVPTGAIDPQWYDRPYYLGPDGAAGSYHALTAALGGSDVEGVARWVMRKKEYAGALRARDGYLTLVSLRHATDVVSIDSIEAPSGAALDAKELEMARQLMQMLEADFEPDTYQDQYRDQVLELIAAKKRGAKPKLELVRPKGASRDLSAALAASLKKERGRRPKEKVRASA